MGSRPSLSLPFHSRYTRTLLCPRCVAEPRSHDPPGGPSLGQRLLPCLPGRLTSLARPLQPTAGALAQAPTSCTSWPGQGRPFCSRVWVSPEPWNSKSLEDLDQFEQHLQALRPPAQPYRPTCPAWPEAESSGPAWHVQGGLLGTGLCLAPLLRMKWPQTEFSAFWASGLGEDSTFVGERWMPWQGYPGPGSWGYCEGQRSSCSEGLPVWGQPRCYGEGPQTASSLPVASGCTPQTQPASPRPQRGSGAVLSCPRHL